MTNEEAIDELEVIYERLSHPEDCEQGVYSFRDGDYLEALDMAIKALEQQPCEDCISRKDVNVLVDELARAISDERCFISRGRSTANIMQDILDLSSVIPAISTGKWIDIGNEGIVFKCSLCGDKNMIESHFCPNCGARMEAETKIEQGLNFADQDTMMSAT